MQKGKQLSEDIEFLSTLRTLCLSYEEISVMKMQKIRGLVLSTRSFFTKLSDVYFNVKSSYKDKIQAIMKKKKITDPSKLVRGDKNGKSVAVLLSANTKLHGSIVDEVFALFTSYINQNPSDLIIIGRLGRELYEKLPKSSGGKKYLYFEIPDMEVNLEDIKSVVYHLLQYEKITVFYGEYSTMMEQIPKMASITGDTKDVPSHENNQKFIFEPKLETILSFFETQIFSSLFKQTVHETQLARFASRIKAMESAIERIEGGQKSLYNEKRRLLRLLENNTQLERLSGMSLWNT